jgi:hypothetical protein
MKSALAALSCSAQKRELYAVDPYFRDGWDDLTTRWGVEGTIARLFDLAPIVFRPDALVARSVERGLRAVAAQGLTPVAHRTFRYSRLSVREGWRYQLNIATRDRIDVMDMIMPATDSLYVVLKRATAATRIPATTRLSTSKGPSLPEHRQPFHLRRLLGEAQVSVLTYVHIADEPADIVRELGIFFDRPQRLEILQAIDAAIDTAAADDVAAAAVARAAQQLYDAIPAHNLRLEDALDRIEAAVSRQQATASGTAATALAEVGRGCRQLRQGAQAWRPLLDAIDAAGLVIDYWDRVAVAATLAERHLEARTVVPDVGELEWELSESMES